MTYAIEHMKEESDSPEVQLQDVLHVFTEYRHYSDFKQRDWRNFFDTFSRKFDQVGEKLSKAEYDRDIFIRDLGFAEAKVHDNTEDHDEIVR